MNKKLFKKLNEKIEISRVTKNITITNLDETALIFGNNIFDRVLDETAYAELYSGASFKNHYGKTEKEVEAEKKQRNDERLKREDMLANEKAQKKYDIDANEIIDQADKRLNFAFHRYINNEEKLSANISVIKDDFFDSMHELNNSQKQSIELKMPRFEWNKIFKKYMSKYLDNNNSEETGTTIVVR